MDDEAAPLGPGRRERILAANDAMTKDALRVLGLAYRVEKNVPDNPRRSRPRNLKRTWSLSAWWA
jgi:magnesium-transporting ATPase (P-type)